MESRRNLRVLPSNAPTLTKSEDVHNSSSSSDDLPTPLQPCPDFNNGTDCRVCGLLHACSTCLEPDHGSWNCKKGILQVSSGNVGSNGLFNHIAGSKVEIQGRSAYKLPSSQTKATDHSAQAALKLEHRRRRRGVDHLLGHIPVDRPELLSPRYNAYRAKSRGKSKSQVWPDHLEEAFQQALRIYPHRGRKKFALGGRQAGGNEFISDYIKRVTGVERDRKQVSSHIQVLKSFLADNAAWLSLVKGVEQDELDRKRHNSGKSDHTGGRWGHSTFINSASSRSSNSTPYITFNTHQALSLEMLGSNPNQYQTISQIYFKMALGKHHRDIHSYTSIQSKTASAPRILEDDKDWRSFYPGLATLHDEGQVHSPVFLLETSLSLTDEFLPKSVLSIDFSMVVTQSTSFTDWQSYTRFYHDKGHLVDLEKFYEDYNSTVSEGSRIAEHAWRPLNDSHVPKTADTELWRIPLKSHWWGRTFSDIMGKMEQAKATESPQIIKRAEQSIEQQIGGISIIQEIWATSRAPRSKPQRIAVLLWRFGKARRDEVGTTSWRRLILPTSSFQIQSPTPPPLQPPLTLDTTLHEAMTRRPTNYHVDYYNPQQPSIFVDNAQEILGASLSERSTPATTPSLDYASFPSSTSTSFPSGISNSGYPSHMVPGSSFQPQNSAYAQLGSFDSQDSHYSSQGFLAHCQDPQEAQEALYHHGDELTYDWAVNPKALPDNSAVSHDFNGGRIEISYGQHESQPNAYEDPLIAPRANMVPQHQMIQHPEQFDHHDFLESNHDNQNIDWQLIGSQPVQVADLRFNTEIGSDLVQPFEHIPDQGTVLEEMAEEHGQILGEIGEEEGQVRCDSEQYQ